MVENALQVTRSINFLDECEIFEIAGELSLEVHPRAIDAYFVATAKLIAPSGNFVRIECHTWGKGCKKV